jgi:general secretion pathway protein C
MRLAIDPRSWRRIRRLPRTSLLSVTELLLLALLAVQCARLIWILVTPLGPLGGWQPAPGPDAERARAVLASGFDPFFRLARSDAAANVTGLQLTLFGTRVDEASGRGAAIIAGPDNLQTSYAVGDEILPGVRLESVAYDHVVISRGGASESLFLDQSGAAPVVTPDAPAGAAPAAAAGAPAPPAPGQPLAADALRQGIAFQPRMRGGRMTGIAVRPQGDGTAFVKAGFRPGDVIVQVGGRPIGGPDDLQRALAGVATRGGNLPVGVERGAETVPVSISISEK